MGYPGTPGFRFTEKTQFTRFPAQLSSFFNRKSVSNTASVTDVRVDSSGPVAVISIPILRRLLRTSHPLCDGNIPPSFPLLVLNPNALALHLPQPLALFLASY